MESLTSWISIVSTFSVLAPLYLLLRNFKSYEFEIKALTLYLLTGFLMDIAGWYFYSTSNGKILGFLRHAYDLFEAVFLSWFLGRVSPYPRIKFLYNWMGAVLFPLWLMRFYSHEWMGHFKIFSQILIAFSSCFFILKIVEKTPEVSRNLIVWILLGIFFYCFCTYFILGTLVFVVAKAWFSHNLVNITTNLIYFIGLMRSKSEWTKKM